MGNEGFFRVTMVAMGADSGATEREAMLRASRFLAFAAQVETESRTFMTRRGLNRWLVLAPCALPARARGRAMAWETFDPAKLGARFWPRPTGCGWGG